MTRLTWTERDPRYTAGVRRGVLYSPREPRPIVWNGLTNVTEVPEGGDVAAYFINGVKALGEKRTSHFAATVSSYMYPAILEDDVAPHYLGFSYETASYSGNKMFRRIHLVYNALFMPSNRNYMSMSRDPRAEQISWDVTTLPQTFPGYLPTAHLMIEVDETNFYLGQKLDTLLYGTETTDGRLLSPAELIAIFDEWVTLRVEESNGIITAEWMGVGPDEAITLGPGEFITIDWPSVVQLDSETYSIESL